MNEEESNPLEDMKKNLLDFASSSEKQWGIICYIPVLNLVGCAVTAVIKVKSQFCLFHARQGLILFLGWFVTLFIGLFVPLLGAFLTFVLILVHIYGGALVFLGKMTKIPFVGDFAMKIPDTYLFKTLTQKKLEGKDEQVASVPEQKPEEPVASAPEQKPEEPVASVPEQKPEEPVASVPEQKTEEPVASVPEQKPEEPVASVPEQKSEEPVASVPEQKPEEPVAPASEEKKSFDGSDTSEKQDQ